MKHRTSELSGALLDAAVAMADGLKPSVQPYRVTGDFGITFVRNEPVCVADNGHFEPSTDWRIGGPIIERERITLAFGHPHNNSGPGCGLWHATITFSPKDWPPHGRYAMGLAETPLVAAMRAYVNAKLGNEVDLSAACV